MYYSITPSILTESSAFLKSMKQGYNTFFLLLYQGTHDEIGCSMVLSKAKLEDLGFLPTSLVSY